jgi:hypothetical protein
MLIFFFFFLKKNEVYSIIECVRMWPSLIWPKSHTQKKLKMHILVKFAEKSKTDSSQGRGRHAVTRPQKILLKLLLNP